MIKIKSPSILRDVDIAEGCVNEEDAIKESLDIILPHSLTLKYCADFIFKEAQRFLHTNKFKEICKKYKIDFPKFVSLQILRRLEEEFVRRAYKSDLIQDTQHKISYKNENVKQMMWLNYVIEKDEVLINFDCDDSIFTSDNESHIDFDAMISAIEEKLKAQFPAVSHFTLTAVKNQNSPTAQFADMKGNISEYTDDEIQDFLNDITNDFDFYDQFF